MSVTIEVDFSGGLESLFGNEKTFVIQLEESLSIKQLVHHLKDRYLQTRPELFLSGDSLRPGILVLINDTDWELCGKGDYTVQNEDKISFISTLHGG